MQGASETFIGLRRRRHAARGANSAQKTTFHNSRRLTGLNHPAESLRLGAEAERVETVVACDGKWFDCGSGVLWRERKKEDGKSETREKKSKRKKSRVNNHKNSKNIKKRTGKGPVQVRRDLAAGEPALASGGIGGDVALLVFWCVKKQRKKKVSEKKRRRLLPQRVRASERAIISRLFFFSFPPPRK